MIKTVVEISKKDNNVTKIVANIIYQISGWNSEY